MATMVSMPLLHPADLAVARSMPSIHVAPHGAVINFYTASGTQSVRGTGQAGIGLFFEKEEYDGSMFPVVRNVTERGSAWREGSIKSGEILMNVDGRPCRDVKLDAVKDMLMGFIGTTVELVVLSRATEETRSIKLSRAPVEYWALYDANMELKASHDALRDKNKENEALVHKHVTLTEKLQTSIKGLEGTVNTARTELVSEREKCRTLASQVDSLSVEKKGVENSMDTLLKKLSEITQHFKSAESLAREMTERARLAEASCNNEESLRKLSENRESEVLSQIIAEIQGRRDLEQVCTEQQDRIAELEGSVQRLINVEAENKRLHEQIKNLQSDVTASNGNFRAASENASQLERGLEDESEQVAATKTELAALLSAATLTEEQLERAENRAKKTAAENESVLKRELELVAEIEQTAAELATAEANLKKRELEIKLLKDQVLEKQNRAEAADAASEQSKKEKYEVENALTLLQREKKSVENAMAAAATEAQIAAKGMDDVLARAQDKAQKLQGELKNAIAGLTEENSGLQGQVHAAAEESRTAAFALEVAEKKVLAALAEQERLGKLLKEATDSIGQLQTDQLAAQEKCLKVGAENEAYESRVKQLESDLAERLQELETQRSGFVQASAEGKAALLARGKLETAMVDLEKQLSASQAKVKDLSVESKQWEMTAGEFEKKLAAREYAFKENVTLNTKLRQLEHELAGMSQDHKKLLDADAEHVSLLDETVKKYEALTGKFTSELAKAKADHSNEVRELRDMYDAVSDERDQILAELERFFAMPNPVGVGMSLLETKTTHPDGRIEVKFTVGGMQAGLSADLSGIIQKDDELLQVNEFLAEDMSLPEMQNHVSGNRGTQVCFRFRREVPEGPKKGESFEYRIVLKRGAWGPEHCVMTPEDLDMVDKQAWPVPGSLTNEDVDMEKITGGVDCSLKYHAKDDVLNKGKGRAASLASQGNGDRDSPTREVSVLSLRMVNRMGTSGKKLLSG